MRKRASSAMVLATVLVLSALGLAARGESSHPSGSGDGAVDSPSGNLGIASGDSPLAFSTRMSLDEAVDAVPYAISRPSDVLASDASIANVWVQDPRKTGDKREIEVAIQYQSGILVSLLPTAAGTEAGFSDVARSLGYPEIVVEKVGDRLSLIIPEKTDGRNVGSVAFVISGVEGHRVRALRRRSLESRGGVRRVMDRPLTVSRATPPRRPRGT